MSDNLIMAEGRGTATPDPENLFSAEPCDHSNLSNPTHLQGNAGDSGQGGQGAAPAPAPAVAVEGDRPPVFSFSELVVKTGKGHAYKSIIAGPDGKPVKDPKHKQGITQAILYPRRLHSLAELGEFIASRHGKNICLVHGVPNDGNTGPRPVVPLADLTAARMFDPSTLARGKDFLGYAESFLMMLDVDTGTKTAQQVRDEWVIRNPEFANAEWLAVSSSSSYIYDSKTGELLKGQGGWHLYFVCRGDLARASEIWQDRYRLAGESFHILSKPNKDTGTTSALERFPVDASVWSPERPDYVTGARTSPEFAQHPPAPQYSPGGWVYLASIPDHTPQQRAEAARIRDQQKAAIKGQRIDITVEHIKKAQPDITDKAARKEAEKRVTACDRGELVPDHKLYLADGRVTTAGEIGPEHHGAQCRDPQEPDYRGGAVVAKIYCEQPGQWVINSFAHGGKVYRPVGSSRAKGKGKGGDKPAEPPKACQVADANGLTEHGGDGSTARRMLMEHFATGKHQPDCVIINGPDGISPEDEAFLLDGNAPKVLTGLTGCGKTEVVARIFKDHRDTLPHQLGLAISITLTGGQAERFGLTPVSSRHDQATGEALDRASVSVESIHRTAGHRYNVLAVDEADVALHRICESVLGKTNQDRNIRQKEKLAQETEHQFYMQANPSPVTLDVIEYQTGKRPQVVEIRRETGQTSQVEVTICENGFDKDADVPLRGLKTLVDLLLGYAKAGKKVVFFCGSVGTLKAIQRILRAEGITVTMRDGSYTLALIAVGFGENPTAHADLRNVTFICRNAETGVDLKNDFDAVFFAASPAQTAEECYQHISRARALFDGRCNNLIVYLPDERAKFVSLDHLDPAYHLNNIRAKHAYYLGLLKDAKGASGDNLRLIEARLVELEVYHGFLARFEAEKAAGQLFQAEYLADRFKSLGWTVESLEPEPARKGDRDFNEKLSELKRKVDHAKAFAIAKGRPTITAFSESRAKQIEDTNQSGFVLDAYRRKITLAMQLPGAPLHDPKWILEHILNDERQLPQARLLGLYWLGLDESAKPALQQLAYATQGHNIRFGMEHGPTALMRSMESSHTLPLLNVWNYLLAEGPRFILDLQTGDRATIHRLEPDVAEFAAKLREQGDRLNSMSRYCLGKTDGFAWDEKDDMAIVNKFLSAFLGLDLVKVGQVRVGDERPPTYTLAGSKIGAFAKSNKAALALARTEGQIGNATARQAAQEKILDAATQAENQGAVEAARMELLKIYDLLANLKITLKEQQQRHAEAAEAENNRWAEVERQRNEHLDMASCAAMGWLERVKPEWEGGVNLNKQTIDILSQFRLTPPETPPPPADNPPGLPPDEALPRLVDIKTGRLFCDLIEVDGDFYLVRWPEGRETLVPRPEYAPAVEVAS